MDKEMKEIHIECAGAGKTYGIAKKIASILDDCPEDKKIYVITYTNYAVKQIRDELVKMIRDIPDKVLISTIHNFFLHNIIYPYSSFIKGEAINSCSIEKLTGKIEWQTKRKKNLRDTGFIHASEVSQYAKSILIAAKTDTIAVKKKKDIAVDYFISDIFCLFVDEAQDMDDYFFGLMFKIINKLEQYYFVGDPFQALWGIDKYKEFTEGVAKQEGITPVINLVSRRIPACIVPLCNRILPKNSALSSINKELGLDNYLKKVNIILSKQDYAKLASQFGTDKGKGIFVEAIQKIKGLEGDTAYFIICNSLLELLIGVKNDLNKETNLLYVALTRAKRRLLFIIDDDEGLKKNFFKRKIDINEAMGELGIQKAVIKEWFI
jgi:superfamily I DNA/RNA helicase